MKFSVIVPSFNQKNFIGQTLQNLSDLKRESLSRGIELEILVFDSESDKEVLTVIDSYKSAIDFLEIKKDKGQFDAINKGIKKASGDYWTWLNTDDLLDEEGFFKLAEILKKNKKIDYIYGGVTYIDEKNVVLKNIKVWPLSIQSLVRREHAIFQPGSWFKREFTEKIGLLDEYDCCFDYEYILRILKNKGEIYACNFPVSQFRLHSQSKTGSNTVLFIREQLEISKKYGRKWYNYLSGFLQLRLIKHFLFPRR